MTTNTATQPVDRPQHDEDLCVIAFGHECKTLATRTLDDMAGFHALADIHGEPEPLSVEVGCVRINDDGVHVLQLHRWHDDRPDRSAPIEVEIYGGLSRLDTTV